MLANITGILLVGLALFALALQRFYSSVPAKEIKRLAARGEQSAVVLFRPVSYGTSLRVLLWIVAGISMPAGFLLMVQNVSFIVALPVMMVALAISSVWIPSAPLTWRGVKIAIFAAPSLDWILHYTHPFLDLIAKLVNSRRPLPSHSGIYEKEDLHELLAHQKDQHDNRINPAEIDIINRALQFGDVKASEIAQPRKDTRMVDSSDSLGPVLLDELHKSKQPYFVVYRGKKDNIAGIISLNDASGNTNGGKVSDIMKPITCFVNEDFNLLQVSRAFISSGQQIAVVVNKFEEFVGILTYGKLMDCLFAPTNEEDDDEISYGDRAAVALFGPKLELVKDEETTTSKDTETDETSLERPEVIE
jgi:CBS domain containing-hemolysin-like protein